ncbi:CpsD/CapB family tyrosine-protein kinase [bacterium AH-315-F03]|nr:CpsD/CapB family tyrosine-protein kinase [bacterium AH-315-F03]
MDRTNRAISIIDKFDIESAAVMEFRRLLHNIEGAYAGLIKRGAPESSESLSAIGARLRRIMVTSALGSEGKSTIASFLAISSAKFKERKTLLVDADLRRPSLHHLFSMERSQGLVEALTEGLPAKRLPKKTELPFLDVITAGKVTEHPSEIFDAEMINGILAELSNEYDFIIVDSAPLLPVTDPMLLSSYMDGVLLVIKAGETSKDVALRANNLLKSNGARTLGVVLNNLNQALPLYYDAGYYKYESDTG